MSKYIYMAGLVDGEGTIGIARDSNSKFRSPYLSISSTTIEIIEWLTLNFGGNVSVQKKYSESHKQAWSWRLRNKEQLFRLLAEIEPFMLEPEKLRRLHLLLDRYTQVTPRNGKYSIEQLEDKIAFEEIFLGGDGGSRTRVSH